MSEEEPVPIPTRIGKDGVPHARTVLTPVADRRRVRCVVPPWTVVPVVFVPGIMGSNLKATQKIALPDGGYIKSGARVWNVDSVTSPMSFWGKGPGYRQAVLNKDALGVDNGGRIAVGSSETRRSPSLEVPPLRQSTGETPLSRIAIEEARQRGWGTVSWQYYGDFLDWLQHQLGEGRLVGGRPNAVFERVAMLVGTAPAGAKTNVAPLTDAQARKMLDIHFPVHAVGYNWLQSNLDSGADLVNGVGVGAGHVMGIDEIIRRYEGIHGQTCKAVIVVTHSMGGLVARAAALAHGAAGKMLGIVHGVQPVDGAAKFYKDLASGFAGDDPGIAGWATAHILGMTAREAIPEIAYNPGPLELAPNKLYNGGKPWLFIKDRQGRVLKALPEHGDPYTEIYLDTTHVWRAVNPEWLDPSGLIPDALDEFCLSVKIAGKYHERLGGRLHPRTCAHWGDDPAHRSWGSMTWSAESGSTWNPSAQELAASQGMARSQWMPDGQHAPTGPERWTYAAPITSAGSRRDLLDAQNRQIRMTVEAAADAGDGTVPAAASGARIAHYAGCVVACALNGFAHQDDYDHDAVRRFLLDALVRLVEPVQVDACD